MSETYPLVSILTPIFNGNRHDYLDRCIQSVLDQTYPNIEHVFSDGGSTDGTLEKIAAYQKKYPGKIRVISEKDNGVGSALKKAYKISKGEVLGWIDSDDYYRNNAVADAMGYFQKTPDARFLYGGCNIINNTNEHIGEFVIRDFNKKTWLNEWHYIVFCACFFKREVIETVGFVNDLGNDLYFYLKVAKHFKMHRIDNPLTNWRLHDESISLKRSERENSIRYHRAKEDFFLVLRHGGSLFSPRAMTFIAVFEPRLAKWLRPFLGFSYPLLRRLSHQMKTCISSVHRSEGGSYAAPIFAKIWQECKVFFKEKRHRS